jgi:hypothetical protein
MFPTLLLASARRKGDYVPDLVFRALGWSPIVIGVYLLFLANIFVHGLIIWQNVLQRVVALTIGVLIVMTTVNMVRRGAFTPRVVVEVRAEDATKDVSFRVSAAGRPIPIRVQLDYDGRQATVQAASGAVPSVDSLRRATFHLPAAIGAELKVWAHRVTRDGESEALPATVTIGTGQSTLDLRLAGGQIVLPLKETPCSVAITLERPGISAQRVE